MVIFDADWIAKNGEKKHACLKMGWFQSHKKHMFVPSDDDDQPIFFLGTLFSDKPTYYQQPERP